MNLKEAAQMALETCTDVVNGWESLAPLSVRRAAIESLDALRAALAEPEQSTGKESLQVQEPVAWQCSECGGTHLLCPHGRKDVPLYTAPQRKPLTDEEIGKIAGDTLDPWSCARAIEKAHGIGEQT